MAGSPEEASSPEEERTTPEASRSSNASSSSSTSSSSSDDDKPSATTAGTLGELDGHEKGASSGVANGRQEEQHQLKVEDAQETGRLSLQGDLMPMLMVAGGVVVAIAVTAAFLANKKR